VCIINKAKIEEGELEMLLAIIQSGDLKTVRYLQIHLYDFVVQSAGRRKAVRPALAYNRTKMLDYEFFWESWKLKVHYR
jgi:hypothetical protein